MGGRRGKERRTQGRMDMINEKAFWLAQFFDDFGCNDDFEIVLGTREYTLKYCGREELNRVIALRKYLQEVIETSTDDGDVWPQLNKYHPPNYIIEPEYSGWKEWVVAISEIMDDHIHCRSPIV